MDTEIVIALIEIVPQVVLIGFAILVAIFFREPFARFLNGRVTSLSAFGFRIDLRPEEVNAAVRARVGSADDATTAPESGNASPTAPSGSQVVDRARRLAPQLAGRVVLWVDDHPELARVERLMLKGMGVVTQAARSNVDAMAILSDPASSIDLVISDIQRQGGAPGGLELLAELRDGTKWPPVILYVGRLRRDLGTPAGAFGITNRADELLNLVMDVMDRRPTVEA